MSTQLQSSLAYEQPVNNINGNFAQEAGFDLGITESVINATGPAASARLRDVIANLTRHLHDFCRESQITRPEFHAALTMVRHSMHGNIEKITSVSIAEPSREYDRRQTR